MPPDGYTPTSAPATAADNGDGLVAPPNSPASGHGPFLDPRHAQHGGVQARYEVLSPPITPIGGEDHVLQPTAGTGANTDPQSTIPEGDGAAVQNNQHHHDHLMIVIENSGEEPLSLTITPSYPSIHGHANAPPVPNFTITFEFGTAENDEETSSEDSEETAIEDSEETVSEGSEETVAVVPEAEDHSDDNNGPTVPNNTPISGSLPSSPHPFVAAPIVPPHIRDLDTMQPPRFGGSSASGTSGSGASSSGPPTFGSRSASGAASGSGHRSTSGTVIDPSLLPDDFQATFGGPSGTDLDGSSDAETQTDTDNTHVNNTSFSPDTTPLFLSPELLRSPPAPNALQTDQPANHRAHNALPFTPGRFGVIGGPVSPIDDDWDCDIYDGRYEIPRRGQAAGQRAATHPQAVHPFQAPSMPAPFGAPVNNQLGLALGAQEHPERTETAQADILLPEVLLPEQPLEVPSRASTYQNARLPRRTPPPGPPQAGWIPSPTPFGTLTGHVPSASNNICLPPSLQLELDIIQARLAQLMPINYDAPWRCSDDKTMRSENQLPPVCRSGPCRLQVPYSTVPQPACAPMPDRSRHYNPYLVVRTDSDCSTDDRTRPHGFSGPSAPQFVTPTLSNIPPAPFPNGGGNFPNLDGDRDTPSVRPPNPPLSMPVPRHVITVTPPFRDWEHAPMLAAPNNRNGSSSSRQHGSGGGAQRPRGHPHFEILCPQCYCKLFPQVVVNDVFVAGKYGKEEVICSKCGESGEWPTEY